MIMIYPPKRSAYVLSVNTQSFIIIAPNYTRKAAYAAAGSGLDIIKTRAHKSARVRRTQHVKMKIILGLDSN